MVADGLLEHVDALLPPPSYSSEVALKATYVGPSDLPPCLSLSLSLALLVGLYRCVYVWVLMWGSRTTWKGQSEVKQVVVRR